MRNMVAILTQEAYDQVSNDTKFVRLTTIMTFIHSIAFLCYLGYTVLSLIAEMGNSSISLKDILQGILDHVSSFGGIGVLIATIIILFIGYYLLPALGEGVLIEYLADEEKKGSRSLGKGLGSFFPMFEFNGMMSFFTPIIFIVVLSRIGVLGILDNIFIIIIISLRALIILFISIFLPFTKYFIVLEKLKPLDAMKKSMSIALMNFSVCFRTSILQYILSLRFIVNICLFLGVPLLVLRGASSLNIGQSELMATITIIASIIIGLLIVYINGIIEAFFITLRYRLFVQLK